MDCRIKGQVPLKVITTAMSFDFLTVSYYLPVRGTTDRGVSNPCFSSWVGYR